MIYKSLPTKSTCSFFFPRYPQSQQKKEEKSFYFYWASEVSPTLTSTIEIEIPNISIKMCGSLLRASATYCVGVAEHTIRLPRSQTPYLKVGFGLMIWQYVDANNLKIEMKRTKREERNNFGKRKGLEANMERLSELNELYNPMRIRN